VRASAQANGGTGAGILESSYTVDPWSRGVHNESRLDRDLLSADLYLRAGDAAPHGTERHHLCFVEHAATGVRGGSHVREAETRVVRRRVRIQRARAKSLKAQGRHELAGSLPTDEPVEARQREHGVENDPALHEGRAVGPFLVQREQELGAAYEVRGDDLRQHAPLVMRLPYQADVAEAEIPQPAVDELRGRA